MRFICQGILFASIAAMNFIPAEAQGDGEVKKMWGRKHVYDSPWTLAYVPQARTGTDAPKQQWFHLLLPGRRYDLAEERPHCFVVSHRQPDYEGQASYLGVAALSIVSNRTGHKEPVFLFRNQGWERKGNSEFGASNTPQNLPIKPTMLFLAHSRADTLQKLDSMLDHQWHGDYLRINETRQSSWSKRYMWDLSEDLKEKLDATSERIDQDRIRFDGQLIRFNFTAKDNSENPPRFCIEGTGREETWMTLFSPHLSGTREFTFRF